MYGPKSFRNQTTIQYVILRTEREDKEGSSKLSIKTKPLYL